MGPGCSTGATVRVAPAPRPNSLSLSAKNPTECPTEVPTEFPTEVPTEVPTEITTEVPTDFITDSQWNLCAPRRDGRTRNLRTTRLALAALRGVFLKEKKKK